MLPPFSAKLSRIDFNLAKKVENATSNIFDPEHREGQAEEGCCSVLILSLSSPWDRPWAPDAAFQHLCQRVNAATSLRLPLSYLFLWDSVSARPDVAAALTRVQI